MEDNALSLLEKIAKKFTAKEIAGAPRRIYSTRKGITDKHLKKFSYQTEAYSKIEAKEPNYTNPN